MMVNVAVFAPIDEALTYSVPDELEKSVRAGHRVLVPLGRRKSVGIVIGEQKHKPDHALKPIEAILDEKVIFSPAQLHFLQWAAEYYLCPLGEILRTALPAPLGKIPKEPKKSPRKKKIPEAFQKKNIPLRLSEKQLEIAHTIEKDSTFRVHLLHGITGSGKTEIYFHLIEKTLAEGKSVLSLVPEISLTPQLYQRYRDRFGDEVALYHSGLNDTERMTAWNACREGQSKIMLGTRSALFASFEKLGLIIIDEEQDHSYKQEERVRYHARDLAILRAKIEDIPILLGSATPSVESYHKAKTGKFIYHELNERFGAAELPKIEVLDLRWDEEKKQTTPIEKKEYIAAKDFVPLKFSLLSPRMLEEMRANLLHGEQSLLLLNRRGFAHYILCEDCGHTPLCPNCEITLTYHKKKARLICHYCDHDVATPKTCPICMGLKFKEKGSGTEKIEDEIQTHFPDAKVARMDRDTTQRKGAHHAILEKLANNEIDILVGTQMIAKGHDYPNVTLVGILSADSCLHLPDFRSSEETFQLITQMAGRAGRAQKPGRVLLQTFSPEHYSIELASRYRIQEFYEKELEQRSELNYPPFSRITVLRIQGTQIHKVTKAAETLAEKLNDLLKQGIIQGQILGPSPCLLEKLRNNYRWQILLKSPLHQPIQLALKQHILNMQHEWLASGLRLVVDVDPVNVV